MTNTDLYKLVNDPNIAYVERDSLFRIIGSDFKVTSTIPREESQWSFQEIQSPSMWEQGYTGRGIKVAVIDSGILKTDDELTIAGGVSTVDYTTDYNDDNGHGTHVAGIIAAKKNNKGTVGIAPDVQLYAVKAMDATGEGTLQNVLMAVEWAINNKMDVINISLASENGSPLLHAMIDQAIAQGSVVVASAGNSQVDEHKNAIPISIPTVTYPAKYNSVIAVGAIDKNFNRGVFSSVGQEVELAAPGVDVVSTYVLPDGTAGYAMASGTSQAAPHVSGMVALLKQKYPGISSKELREKLSAYAVDIGTPGRDSEFGFGAVTFDREAPAEVANVLVTGKTDTSISLSWTNPSDSDFQRVKLFSNGMFVDQTAGSAYQFTGLTPNTMYELSAKTVDARGNISQGQSVTISTYGDTTGDGSAFPTSISNLTVGEITTTNAEIHWTNPVDANFAKLNIYINEQLVGETSGASYIFHGLDPDTEYLLSVRVVDPSGNLSMASAVQVRTKAVPVGTIPEHVDTVPASPAIPPISSGGGSSSGGGGGGGGLAITPPVAAQQTAVNVKVDDTSNTAAASKSIIELVDALSMMQRLVNAKDYGEQQKKIETLKRELKIADLPVKDSIRATVPIGINLQVAMKSSNYKYIDESSLKLGENMFVLDSKYQLLNNVKIYVLFNRIFVAPLEDQFASHEAYTIIIGTTVKGKPSKDSDASFELKQPLMLEFITR